MSADKTLSRYIVDDFEKELKIGFLEEAAQAITLSQTEGRYIQLLTMVLVPLFALGAGVVTYARRRKL